MDGLLDSGVYTYIVATIVYSRLGLRLHLVFGFISTVGGLPL